MEGLNCIDVSQDKEYLWAFVNIMVQFVLNKFWIILSCSGKILPHIVSYGTTSVDSGTDQLTVYQYMNVQLLIYITCVVLNKETSFLKQI